MFVIGSEVLTGLQATGLQDQGTRTIAMLAA